MTATRVAVVTGAAQGIGRRVAEVLAEKGYELALTDLHEAGETAAAVRERGREALDVPGDVSAEADVAALAEQVREHFGRVEVLVNNAGISFNRACRGDRARAVAAGAGSEPHRGPSCSAKPSAG